MTSSPPPDPNSRRDDRRFDELIAVVVALLGIGSIFFWSLGQKDEGFDLFSSLTAPAASPQPTAAVPNAENGVVLVPETRPGDPSPQVAPTIVPTDPLLVSPATPVRPRTVPYGVAAVPAPTAVPSPSPSPTITPGTRFSDVPPDYWAAPFIVALADRGVIQGFAGNTFQPDKPVTRAEFAAMLQKAFVKPIIKQPLTYKDVSANYWARPAISEATQTGFMNGYPDRTFRPNQVIPKAQALIAIATGLGLEGQPSSRTSLNRYQDAREIPRYATQQIAAATDSGLVVNYPQPKQLTPNRITSRAEAAALIYQALVNEGKVDRLSSDYIVQP